MAGIPEIRLLIAEAAATRYGIEIETNDRDRFRQRFHVARRQMLDEGIEEARRIGCSFFDDAVWLVHKPEDGKPISAHLETPE